MRNQRGGPNKSRHFHTDLGNNHRYLRKKYGPFFIELSIESEMLHVVRYNKGQNMTFILCKSARRSEQVPPFSQGFGEQSSISAEKIWTIFYRIDFGK